MKKQKLTEVDILIINFVAEQDAVRLDTLVKYLQIKSKVVNLSQGFTTSTIEDKDSYNAYICCNKQVLNKTEKDIDNSLYVLESKNQDLKSQKYLTTLKKKAYIKIYQN